jgi:hypothetical protein
MAVHGLQILHAISGRLRVKVGMLKDNPALADECQGWRERSRRSLAC